MRSGRSIGIDTKSRSLLKALEVGFARMSDMGANRKVLIFTESRRTQDYLKNFLESNGYAGQIVLFNGTNADPESRRIIDCWIDANAAAGRTTGSCVVDSRTALIEQFRDTATVDRHGSGGGRHQLAILRTGAAVACSLEGNNRLFSEERERLEKWAEDMVFAAEKDLADTKAQIKAVRRQARLAATLDVQNELQQKLQELERKQRRQRQQIFDIEDQIAEKRDKLIDGLQKRMSQKTATTPLFTIRWAVV